MFKKTKAKTVASYLAAVPADRKADLKALHVLIRKAAPGLKPWFAYNMPGYGAFPYTNYKGEKGKWPVISLASQKQYVSIYVCAVRGRKYLAEMYARKLGKVNVGRSCIRFRKLADVNISVLKEVIREAAKRPGLVLSSGNGKR